MHASIPAPVDSGNCPSLKPPVHRGREIQSLTAQVPGGLASTMFEAAYPAQFWAAHLFSANDIYLCSASTGSGHEAHDLLRALLQALANGKARFFGFADIDLVEHAEALEQFRAEADGRAGTLSAVPGGFLLEIEEGRTFRGTPVVGRTLWFESKEFAIKVGEAVSENMLDFD